MIDYLFSLTKSNNDEVKESITLEKNNNLIKIRINKYQTFEELLSFLSIYFDRNIINSIPKNILDESVLKRFGQDIYIVDDLENLLIFTTICDFQGMRYVIYDKSKSGEELNVSINQSLLSFSSALPSVYTLNYFLNGQNYSYVHHQDNCNDLERKKALALVKKMLNKLEKLDLDASVLDLNRLYYAVNIIRNYNPVIYEQDLALSIRKNNNLELKDLNKASFDIVIAESKEVVGIIDFDYSMNDSDFYFGNVSYAVNPSYRNKGYATRALKMIKEFVKDVKAEEKDLYISVKQNNISSQKVAIKNGGELYYSGKIPEESAYALSEECDINIYRIKI